MFSDISVSLEIEMQERKIHDFLNSLKTIMKLKHIEDTAIWIESRTNSDAECNVWHCNW